jgi:hypothetical protein
MTDADDQAIIDAALAARRGKVFSPGSSVTMVEPMKGVLPVANLKSLDNWRAFIHQFVSVIVPVLVALNLTTETQVMAWVPFVFAIADNVLSVGNTTDRIRKAIYAGFGVLQTGGLVTVLLSSAPEYIPIISAVMTVGSAFLARFYTPTTTMQLPAEPTLEDLNAA